MIYIEEFRDNSQIIKEYAAPEDALDGATVLLAWYGCGNYYGRSLVIFEKDGKLFEVNGAHCSCYGLEGQWEPEETCWGALAMRDLSHDECNGSAEADEALKALVKERMAL